MYVCMYVCMYACVYIYIYMPTYIYIYIYIYITNASEEAEGARLHHRDRLGGATCLAQLYTTDIHTYPLINVYSI